VGADDDRGALPAGPRRFKTRPEVRGRIAAYVRPARRKPSADEIARALLLPPKAKACHRRSGSPAPVQPAHPSLEPRPIHPGQARGGKDQGAENRVIPRVARDQWAPTDVV